MLHNTGACTRSQTLPKDRSGLKEAKEFKDLQESKEIRGVKAYREWPDKGVQRVNRETQEGSVQRASKGIRASKDQSV